MRIIFLFFLLFAAVLLKAQEPDRVKILHTEAVQEAYVETFHKNEIKQAASYTFTLQVTIKANGRICDAQIINPDSTSLVFQKKEMFLQIIEKRMRIGFYSQSFKNWIKRSKQSYCISLLISKGSIFDYENQPFKCK